MIYLHVPSTCSIKATRDSYPVTRIEIMNISIPCICRLMNMSANNPSKMIWLLQVLAVSSSRNLKYKIRQI